MPRCVCMCIDVSRVIPASRSEKRRQALRDAPPGGTHKGIGGRGEGFLEGGCFLEDARLTSL
eukprot:547622-Pyramimonas_sp.AAC.1